MRTSERVRRSSYKHWLRDSSIVALVAAACMLLGTTPLRASCGFPANPKPGNALKPSPLPAQEGEPNTAPTHSSIVGLWHVILTQSSGDRLWQSFQQFHADGLEMENADITPIGSNVCMGVWEKVRSDTVKIYHVAWTFDPASGAPTGSALLTETNTLNKDGNSFTGTFAIQFYDANGDKLIKITGTTAATRISFSLPFTAPSTP